MSLGTLAVLLLATTAALFAQRPVFDAFEVASIKDIPADNREGRYMRMEGAHQFYAKNYTIKHLVMAAYHLTERTIAGGPSWIDTDHYDIRAVTPGDVRPNTEEQMTMLRRLLTDRFQLAFHRETREGQLYRLTILKGGSKLKPTTGAGDQPALINEVHPGFIHLPARNATIAEFLAMMQRAVVDRPIVDETGLAGRYDFDLEWTPDETQFAGAFPNFADSPLKPDLFSAMQQQLGLKLESAKGPVDVLVVDRVQRPTAN
jgi:uncharacterized protein (TIGR03435 family)